MSVLTLANTKGGVGKSLLAILATEWFLHRGKRVLLRDADDNQTLSRWAQFCLQKGRGIPNMSNPDVEIIDTAGARGSMDTFLARADVILVPFKGLTPDVDRLVRWYKEDLSAAFRRKVFVVPNMIRFPNPTRDHVRGFQQVQKLLELDGRPDAYLVGLGLREAVYGRVYNGSAINFFDRETGNEAGSNSLGNANAEASQLFMRVELELGL